MAQAKKLRTVRQTFDELKRFGSVNDILKGYRDAFQIPTEEQFHEDVSALIEILGNDAPYLWERTGGKNPDPADPWIVGKRCPRDWIIDPCPIYGSDLLSRKGY
jgi:hypothetical protein